MYAVRRGRPDLQSKLTSNNLRTSMAIMYLTGYLTPSNRLLFWENRPDCSNMFVKRAMSRNLFQDIVRFTYFVDTVVPDAADRFWKVRPLFDHLNKTAKQYVQPPATVSVDEGMVKYFGPHPLKQFIRGKPVRFGYKMWILASPQGELLAVQPYAGASTNIQDFGLGQGPNVVMGLVQQYGLLPGSKVYVDNLFTSLDLLDNMGDRQYGVTGTLRQNRIIGIPLPNKKQANKQLKRGEMQAVYTQDAVVAVWKDNQPVYMASNCDPVEPLAVCQRYSRKDRGYVPFSQPNLNKLYNKSMGGVDLLDNSTKNYAIRTRVRKWYWCLYTWFLNVTMVQAWRLYRAHKRMQHRLAQVNTISLHIPGCGGGRHLFNISSKIQNPHTY
jgi:DNA excision repair protein ERCC-6